MKIGKLLRRLVPSYRSFARFTMTVALGAVLGLAAGPTFIRFFTALPSAFDSVQGNWYPDRFARSGVLKYDHARAQPGYTFFTLAPDLSAHLIDMNGREVHKWFVPFDEVAPSSGKGVTSFFGAAVKQIEGGHFYPNGDVLLIYEVRGLGAPVTPIVKLDKDSRIIWKSTVSGHHDLEVVGDKIYVLNGAKPRRPDPNSPQPRNRKRVPFSGNEVSVLDSRGKTLSSHSIMDAIVNTDDLRLVDLFQEAIRHSEEADLHSNSIDVLTEQTAHFIPGAKPGNVLLSIRTMDMLVVMDLEAEKIVWALRGSFRQQHNAKMLPNGHILLFDNRGDLYTRHGLSRVLEIDPSTGGIVWSYDGTDDDPLESPDNRGGAQRLANGNTLISEANSGRILEVTPDKKVVWEFVNNLQRMVRGKKYISSFGLNVNRYDPSYVKFLGPDENHVATH